MRRMRYVLSLIAFFNFCVVASTAQAAKPAAEVQVPQLAVLFAASPSDGITAEQAIEMLNGSDSRFESRDLRARAGNPTRARFFLSARLPAQIRGNLSPDNPLEILHRWLVLDYPGNAEAGLARAAMVSAPGIFRRVDHVLQGLIFSSTPSDPYYSYNAAPIGFGGNGASSASVYGLLSIPNAWDSLIGNAYVGLFDNGVDGADFSLSSPAIHPDLSAKVRGHFSWRTSDHGRNVDEAACTFSGVPFPVQGHGTHVAGLIAASANNGNGSSGVCPGCSLAVARHGVCDANTDQTFANAIQEAAMQGLQVFSHSGGMGGSTYHDNDLCTGSLSTQPVLCVALALASDRDMTYVAASGNWPDLQQLGLAQHTQFPAKQPNVISVGATNEFGVFSTTFSAVGKVDFTAPGERVFSTFFRNGIWRNDELYSTGSACQRQSTNTSDPLNGYGYCSGTSMSTPIIAGSYGLVRSADPLLKQGSVTAIMRAFASSPLTVSTSIGSGSPNVGASVKAALWGAWSNNGITPLFSLYVPGGFSGMAKHFYTTVPQMAAAANCMGLKVGYNGWLPAEAYLASNLLNSADGAPVGGYLAFPGACTAPASSNPVASMKIFTTPTRFGQSLVPLLRASYNAQNRATLPSFDGGANNSARSSIVGHAYATLDSEMSAFVSVGYVFDGIEGYLYPPTVSQPFGTIGVYRRYNASLDDYGLFTTAQLSTAGAGYAPMSGYQDLIGYACPNSVYQVGVCANQDSYDIYAAPTPVDFDHDGMADIAWNRGYQGGYWLMGAGSAIASAGTLAGPSGAVIWKVADFDGDGKSDILWRHPSGQYFISMMNGSTILSTTSILAAGTTWEVVGTGDLNGDGKADLIWREGASGTYGAWLMNGASYTLAGAITQPGPTWRIVAAGDFDHDLKTDFVWYDGAGSFKIILMNGLAAAAASAPIVTDNSWAITHVGDFNGDGKTDLIWRRTDGSSGAWLMNGLSWSAYTIATPGSTWRIAAVGDFNADGKSDLLLTDDLASAQVWLMDGSLWSGSVVGPVSSASYSSPGDWRPVITRDFSGDGKADVLWRKSDGNFRSWTMNGTGYTETVYGVPYSGWEPLP